MDEQRLKKVFGNELRKARTSVGLSQEKLALQVGLDRTYISMLERGLRQPTLTTLILLGSALDISGSELVRKTEEKI